MGRASVRLIGNNNSGFSLVEVMVTMVILSIGFLGLAAMTISTITSLTFSKEMTTATLLSQDKIEEIKNTDYADVTSANYPEEGYHTIPDHPEFRRVVAIATGALANTKNVTVTTSWQDKESGSSHTVSIQTIISN